MASGDYLYIAYYKSPQCLRCLSDIQNNKPCTCKQCSDCLIYYVPTQPHINCNRNKIYCAVCNNGIISSSRLCLYCENEKKKQFAQSVR